MQVLATLASRIRCRYCLGVFFPLLLILLAMIPAALVGFGTDSRWGELLWGMDLILFTRRLLWPLTTFSLLACVGLLSLVVSGKRRAWWLIGLAPILAFFVQGMMWGPAREFSIAENPPLVAANLNADVRDGDFVVGLVFEGKPYAFPYSSLYHMPVIVQADREKRMILLWSALANRVLAFQVDRSIRARELEIVSMPAGAIVVYNSRLGQFINSVTGQTPDGQKPKGFGNPIVCHKTTWGEWRKIHSQSQIMIGGEGPREPISPAGGIVTKATDAPGGMRVALIDSEPPIAIPSDQITTSPTNLSGAQPAFVFRDRSGRSRAFDRRIEPDLPSQFQLNTDRRKPKSVFVDSVTGTGWDENGNAVDAAAPFREKKLKELIVEENLHWGILRHWYPDLTLHRPATTQPAR
jgi:hypothetical protein